MLSLADRVPIDGDLALLAYEVCRGKLEVAHARYLADLRLQPGRAPGCSLEDLIAWYAEHVRAGSVRPPGHRRSPRNSTPDSNSTVPAPPQPPGYCEGRWAILRHGGSSGNPWRVLYNTVNAKRAAGRFAKELKRVKRGRVVMFDPEGRLVRP